MTAINPGASVATEVLSKKKSLLLLIGLLCGVLLEAFDTNMLNPAMKTIVRDLGGGIQMSPWVITSYLITLTVMTPIYARLSDLYGRLPFYLGGMSLFMLGSICSGISQNLNQLIIFRILQGLGAGAMMPIAITLAQTVFPLEQRGKVQGIIPMAFGIAAILGPSLGGFVTEHWGWRWLFYLNLPFGLIAMVLLFINLPPSARFYKVNPRPTIDMWGILTLMGTSTSLMLGLAYLGQPSTTWHSPAVLCCFGLFLCMLFAFLWIETKVEHPLISLHLFRNPVFSLSVLLSFLLGGMILWSIAVYVSMFMQGVLLVGATRSGTLLTPMMLAIAIGSFFSGRMLGTRVRSYKPLALLAGILVVLGTGLLLFTHENSPLSLIVLSMVLTGIGIGASFPLYGMVAASHVEQRFIGVSFGLIAFFRNLGASVSLSLFGTLFGKVFATKFMALLPPQFSMEAKKHLLEVFSGAGEGTNIKESLHQIPASSAFFFQQKMPALLADALYPVFIGGFCVALFAFLIALFLPKGQVNLHSNKKHE